MTTTEFPTLPAKPLADALTPIIERHAAGIYQKGERDRVELQKGGKPNPLHGSLDGVCTGLGTTLKSYKDWRDGVRTTVRFDVADKILCYSGLGWWEVWPGDPVVERAFTGEVSHAH